MDRKFRIKWRNPIEQLLETEEKVLEAILGIGEKIDAGNQLLLNISNNMEKNHGEVKVLLSVIGDNTTCACTALGDIKNVVDEILNVVKNQEPSEPDVYVFDSSLGDDTSVSLSEDELTGGFSADLYSLKNGEFFKDSVEVFSKSEYISEVSFENNVEDNFIYLDVLFSNNFPQKEDVLLVLKQKESGNLIELKFRNEAEDIEVRFEILPEFKVVELESITLDTVITVNVFSQYGSTPMVIDGVSDGWKIMRCYHHQYGYWVVEVAPTRELPPLDVELSSFAGTDSFRVKLNFIPDPDPEITQNVSLVLTSFGYAYSNVIGYVQTKELGEYKEYPFDLTLDEPRLTFQVKGKSGDMPTVEDIVFNTALYGSSSGDSIYGVARIPFTHLPTLTQNDMDILCRVEPN